MITVKSIRLKVNPTIGIFSPSEPVIESRMEKFNNGIAILKQEGFEIAYGEYCFAHTNFTAGTILNRVTDINSLLEDKQVDMLLSSWGGKSCNELLNHLDYDLIKEKRKPIIGFSDPCVLSNTITAKTDLITFYGPNVVGKMNETTHSDFNILKQSSKNHNIFDKSLKKDSKSLLKGNVTGKLIGGNLSTFTLGVACSEIDLSYYDDSILIWEDIGNPPQIINQYLRALENRGVLKRLKGMVIGYFISKDSKPWKEANPFAVIENIISKYKIPTLYIPVFGHAVLENPIFPIGAMCTLNTENMSLTILEEILE